MTDDISEDGIEIFFQGLVGLSTAWKIYMFSLSLWR